MAATLIIAESVCGAAPNTVKLVPGAPAKLADTGRAVAAQAGKRVQGGLSSMGGKVGSLVGGMVGSVVKRAVQGAVSGAVKPTAKPAPAARKAPAKAASKRPRTIKA